MEFYVLEREVNIYDQNALQQNYMNTDLIGSPHEIKF